MSFRPEFKEKRCLMCSINLSFSSIAFLQLLFASASGRLVPAGREIPPFCLTGPLLSVDLYNFLIGSFFTLFIQCFESFDSGPDGLQFFFGLFQFPSGNHKPVISLLLQGVKFNELFIQSCGFLPLTRSFIFFCQGK